MTIALTGATGFVGQAVLDRAASLKLDVRALTRRERGPRRGVEWVPGDLANRAALAELVRECETVIHVAGMVKAPDPAAFEVANVTGTLEVIEAAVKAGVRRFVFVSSLAAREPAISAYGASKHRAERLVSASGLDWTTVRPPAIYGPRDREMLDLFKAAKWGVVPMPPPGRASLIHVDDLARLLLTLREGGEDVTHRLFEPDDGREQGWSHRDMALAIGEAVGRSPWVPHLSKPTLMKLSAAERFFRRDAAKLTADRVGYMTHPDWVASPALKVPGHLWVPHIPSPQGLKDTAEWYRDEGWL